MLLVVVQHVVGPIKILSVMCTIGWVVAWRGSKSFSRYHVVARLMTDGLVRGQPAAGNTIVVLSVEKVLMVLHYYPVSRADGRTDS